MRCGALHIHDAPGPVFRNMLAALDAPHSAPYSEVYQVYTGLHRCGYLEPWHSTPNLSHFSKHIVEDPMCRVHSSACTRTATTWPTSTRCPRGPATAQMRSLTPALDAPLSPAPPPHPRRRNLTTTYPSSSPPRNGTGKKNPTLPPCPCRRPGRTTMAIHSRPEIM